MQQIEPRCSPRDQCLGRNHRRHSENTVWHGRVPVWNKWVCHRDIGGPRCSRNQFWETRDGSGGFLSIRQYIPRLHHTEAQEFLFLDCGRLWWIAGVGLSSGLTIDILLSEAIGTFPFERVKCGWDDRIPQNQPPKNLT